MRLILSEFRKACAARAVAVFFIVLLAANFALTYYTARPMPVEEAARVVWADYLSDPEAVASYMDQLESDFFEHIRDEEFEPPRTYTDGADDVSVLNRVLSRAEYLASFRAETEKISDMAERRARDLGYLGYGEEGFYIREQQRLAEVYSRTASALDGCDSYAYGYDIYLENPYVCVFIALYLVFAVSFIFRNDGVCGIGSILRTTPKGRAHTAFAKLAAALTVSLAATLIFLGTTLLATGLANGGLSSPLEPIQSLPGCSRVPFETSILGFICIQTLFRLLAACVFALFVALAASLGLNYVFCFGISALFGAANYFIFSHEYVGSVPPLKYLNLASAAEGAEIFAFHRDLSFFGTPIAYTAALAVISVAILAAFAILCVCARCKTRTIPSHKLVLLPKKKEKGAKGVKEAKRSELRLCSLLPLWVYELKKNRALPLSVLALLLLAAHGIYISASVGDGMGYGEAIYYCYIAEIKDLSSDQRTAFLSRERGELEAVVWSYAKISEAMESGEIGYDEYAAYLPEYYSAKNKLEVLSQVEDYTDYIERQSEKLGYEPDVIYGTGYEKFFASGADFFTFAAILAHAVGIFAVEYRCAGCAQVIITAKRGRKPTFFSKILPYTLIGACLCVLSRAVGLSVTACKYPLPEPSSHICSLRAFESAACRLTIAEYLALDLVCSALAGALIVLTVCALSCLCKRTLPALGASSLLIALPALLGKSPLILLNLTAPNRIFCSSFEFGREMHVICFVSIILLHVTAVAALTAAAKKRWGN